MRPSHKRRPRNSRTRASCINQSSRHFQIQGLDADRLLLEETVRSYEQSLQLTEDRFQGGVVSMADVALARTQLESARAQLADLGIVRAQFDHAIATLTGRPPSEFSMPTLTTRTPPPVIPVGLPSSLLERRPDVAVAERQVAAAHHEIGVANAALFPALTFGASAGAQALSLAELVTEPTRLWSLGVQLAATIFDGGKRRASRCSKRNSFHSCSRTASSFACRLMISISARRLIS